MRNKNVAKNNAYDGRIIAKNTPKIDHKRTTWNGIDDLQLLKIENSSSVNKNEYHIWHKKCVKMAHKDGTKNSGEKAI